MRRVSIEFVITDEVEQELDQLHAIAQNYKGPVTGKNYFQIYDRDQLLQAAMEVGSTHIILDQLKLMKKLLSKEA